MSIPFDYRECLMAADVLHGRQIDTSLDKMGMAVCRIVCRFDIGQSEIRRLALNLMLASSPDTERRASPKPLQYAFRTDEHIAQPSQASCVR